MKKFFTVFMMMLLSVNMMMAQYGPTKFTDNTSVEIKGGVSTPMSSMFEGVSPVIGVGVEKYVTPWMGFEIEATALINNPYGTNNPHTFIDETNVGMLGKINVLNLVNYNGTRKFFEPVAFAGIGWGHEMCTDVNKDFMITKAGVELNFHIDKENAWAIRLKPAVVWGPTDNNKLSLNSGRFEITAGVAYHFKNKDGNRSYTKIVPRSQHEIDALNDKINAYRTENAELRVASERMRQLLKRKPTERIVEKIDTVMLMPDLQFKQGSRYLEPTSEATIIKMAEYMKASNKKYTLMGYASIEGSIRHNEQLSLWRAETIKNKLIEYGVNADNLEAVGYGATDKFSKEIRELNRIVIIQE